MPDLTIDTLKLEASIFAEAESQHDEPSLYGVTDGKAIGTYFEQKLRAHLRGQYDYEEGSSARGIDFPGLSTDMKVTSVRQPQSSSPYRSARQKIYGLGYSLLIFVYAKTDNAAQETGRLDIRDVIFVEASRTGDYQMTTGINSILQNDGNKDDLIAFMTDRMLPVDDIEASNLADELLATPPQVGYLTISNALQWRLQFRRVINEANNVDGVVRVR